MNGEQAVGPYAVNRAGQRQRWVKVKMKAQTKQPADNADRANAVLKELWQESDRAMAILAGAEIDKCLAEILEAFLVPPNKFSAQLLEADGPLGSMSSRIETVYRLGLIPSSMQHDLHLLRKIRNKFAHGPAGLAFSNDQIRDLCANLVSPNISSPGSKTSEKMEKLRKLLEQARQRYQIATAILLGQLMMVRSRISRTPSHWQSIFVNVIPLTKPKND